ncbi:hypothetical protein bsdtb5_08590 [Anaeromicropila herbilytica]|uniref:Uncharacterized protein n=2 Tax=Anaeromicropila herbilytica TaxID=2785025 RepID=A0A7R7EIY2_9FIRM|nr:hypothetical protein bsdtb5_08590 [Anaeromicropila herbilytica]
MKSSLGIIFPSVFAIGTLIPLLSIVILLYFNKQNKTIDTKQIRKLQKVIRISGGTILILLGIIDTFIYWLN